jgi:biopolymer transport protein ExbB/TolQ
VGLLILITDLVEKLILISLFGLSIWSVSILIDRYRLLRKQTKNSPFLELKEKVSQHQLKISSKHDADSYIVGLSEVLLKTHQNPDSLMAGVSSYSKIQRMQLEKGLAVLATLGSNAPFIGLFGTVLGIIRAFAYLGSQSGTASVMSGISQALFATAFGLFVAIPAVIGFNLFSKMIKDLMTQGEALRDLYIAELKIPDGKK